MDRVVVKPHKAADLIEQPGGWGLTFHGMALVFWGSDSSKTISRTIDNGPGTFDLKPCSISSYQVKVQCQSMVRLKLYATYKLTSTSMDFFCSAGHHHGAIPDYDMFSY